MTTVARRFACICLCASFALVAACGDDDAQQNNNNHLLNNNGNLNQNNNQVQQDGSVQNDAATGSCTHNGFTPVEEEAVPFDSGQGYYYSGYSSTEQPLDILAVEMYTSTEYNPPTSPGTYSLSGSNYQTCGLCLLIYANCDNASGCQKTYYADEGSVEITSLGSGLGSTFSGNLQNVVFKEVTINEQSYLSTPVPGGDTWCANGYTFNQQLVDPNSALCGQSDINCIGETVPDFSLVSCNTATKGDVVSMRTYASGANALWFVGSHGWCSACSSAMPGFLSYYDANQANGLKMAIVMGDGNVNGTGATLDQCETYANQYSGHEDLVFLDVTGGDAHMTLFTNLYYYPDSQQMIGFPWQAVVDPSDWSYDYADGDGSGNTAESVINGLLP